MPVSKVRGKSAVLSNGPLLGALPTTEQHNNLHPTISLNNHPLLKIESVVPTAGGVPNARHSRMIRRSRSTVSSAYLRKVADSRSRTVAALNRCNVTDNESSTTKEDHQEKGPNAFQKIKRSRKERDKYPDRINLDRKGLTIIPVIADEPQLRLLSLQHNLINSFHVPEIEEVDDSKVIPTAGANSVNEPCGIKQVEHHSNHATPSKPLCNRPGITGYPLRGRQMPGFFYQNAGGGPGSVLSTSSTPSILINGIPNYGARSVVNGKTLQSLSINQKMILKKGSHIASLNPFAIPKNNQRTKSIYGKSNSEVGVNNLENHQTPCALTPIIPCVYGDTLMNLVFLDLYDNQIEKIGNLSGLKSLTVLLLGKNRIFDITGIVSLRDSLRVLDLHGNRISTISNKICRLQELKSLNLAGNTMRQIFAGDFAGLHNLRELNLKRNRIKRLAGFEDLHQLERLWLCNNDLHRVEDMSCIARAINLKEITIENNPVSLAGDCCSFLVSYLPHLVMLSQMVVTDQVKRAAMAWRKSKAVSDSNFVSISSEVCQSIRREEVIINARTNWELLRSQPLLKSVHKSQSHQAERDLNIGMATLNLETNGKMPKLEKNVDTTDIQEKAAFSPETHNTPTTNVASNTNELDCLRLPPIIDQDTNLDTLLPQFKTENVSVEDSLGANIDSTSIFSGGSSSSSCRSCDAASSTSELMEDTKVEAREPPPKEHFGQKYMYDEDDEVRVAFPKKGNPNNKLPSEPLQTNLKMPTIKLSEYDRSADTGSNGVASSLRTEHPAATSSAVEDETSSAVRSLKGKCGTSRKLLSAGQPTTQKIQQTSSRLSHSTSGNMLVVNTNSSTAKSNSLISCSANSPQNSQPLPSSKVSAIDREREQGGDYLIEICGRYLNVYGVGALKFVDKQWNVQKAGDVHTVKFSYINFNNISAILGKIKARFSNAENFTFRETNITCLGQLNSLAEIQSIQSIVIEADGNLICTKKWRSYAIFRLSHWGLKQINGQDILDTEMAEAERTYGQLPDLVLWCLPESLLAPLLGRLRLEEPCQASRLSAKEWLMQAESSLKCVVGKEALQWRKSTSVANCNNLFDDSIRVKGQQCLIKMMENTCNAVEKLQRLETLWPTILTELIKNTLIDYSQIDTYVKNLPL